jgi:hypothetical protein
MAGSATTPASWPVERPVRLSIAAHGPKSYPPPLAPEVLEHPDGAFPRPGPAIDAQEPRHVGIAEQGDQPLKVVVMPAWQEQAGGGEAQRAESTRQASTSEIA